MLQRTPHRALRGRRGALHLRVGPQLPPRLPEAGRDRPHARRASGCWRSPPPPRPPSCEDICAALRHPARAARSSPASTARTSTLRTTPVRAARARRAAARARCATRPPGPTIVYVTLQKTAERVADVSAERRAARPRLPRGHGAPTQRTAVQEWWMASRPRHRRRHHRLRHGHRQGRRALRLPLQPAQEPGELQPGDRPRRPRRRALASSRCSPARTTCPTLENFAYGDTPTEAALRGPGRRAARAGRSFDVSLDRARPSRHDIRPLVLRTALTYLELLGVLRQGTPVLRRLRAAPARCRTPGDRRAVRGRAGAFVPQHLRRTRRRAASGTGSIPGEVAAAWARPATASCAPWSTSQSTGWPRCERASLASATPACDRATTRRRSVAELTAPRFERRERQEIARIQQVLEPDHPRRLSDQRPGRLLRRERARSHAATAPTA